IMESREAPISGDQARIIRNLYDDNEQGIIPGDQSSKPVHVPHIDKENIQDTEEFVEESLSLEEKEIELIKKALEKHKGKRKYAAKELGISERTLYRKIKEYDING
ncbi:MAG: helix-turn-helix domain-containing protein, partial [Prolixibacteraceae bacterium]